MPKPGVSASDTFATGDGFQLRATENFVVSKGKRLYFSDWSPVDSSASQAGVYSIEPALYDQVLQHPTDDSAALRGFIWGTDQHFITIIEDATNRAILPDLQMIEGRPSVVVEATTSSGQYKFFFSSESSHELIRVEVLRKWDDLFFGKPVWRHLRDALLRSPAAEDESANEQDKKLFMLFTIDEIVDDQPEADGAMFPTSMHVVKVSDTGSGVQSRLDMKIARNSFVASPAITQRTFTIDIPNGTTAYLMPVRGQKLDGVPREWRDGNIIPVVDHIALERIDESTLSPSTQPLQSSPESTVSTSTLIPWLGGGVGVLAVAFSAAIVLNGRR